jgi:hypothetical protein
MTTQAGSELTAQVQRALLNSVRNTERVQGLTHSFYRYPARFSPQFARIAIEQLTRPGDFVFDPFMGGGTTLVEAFALGRRSAGFDISALAAFLTRVKTTLLTEADFRNAAEWANHVIPTLTLHQNVDRPLEWIAQGYQRNINGVKTWPIRKSLELAIASLNKSASQRLANFLRCAVLDTGRWALDCRSAIPCASTFRLRLRDTVYSMINGMHALQTQVEQTTNYSQPIISHSSAAKVAINDAAIDGSQPRLILTSPPYPGVHVLYHRWQINGRRETAAPFWLANERDGKGAAYYTLGGRKQKNLANYFANLRRCFGAIRNVAGPNTLIVQLVAFSDPAQQLMRYLEVMHDSGFREMDLSVTDDEDGRIWREVPNRRWYASSRPALASGNEVLLLHQPYP